MKQKDFHTQETQNSSNQQYIKNLEVSQKKFFSSQEKLSYHELVLKSPQKEAFNSLTTGFRFFLFAKFLDWDQACFFLKLNLAQFSNEWTKTYFCQFVHFKPLLCTTLVQQKASILHRFLRFKSLPSEDYLDSKFFDKTSKLV